jgi:hypothetical protein
VAYIYKNPYPEELAKAQQELQYAIEQREQLNHRIYELECFIASLTQLAQNEQLARGEQEQVPLPQLCLRVLASESRPMSVPEVRDGLRRMGIEVIGANPLGILHTALGRLTQGRHVNQVPSVPGGPARYQITATGRLALAGF